MKKYVIVEVIPSTRNINTGDIVQLSALKLEGFNLIDRFDYRLNEDRVVNPQLKKMTNYDKENFIYCETTNEIIKAFKSWIGKNALLIIDNDYTLSYLSNIKNKKESIFKYLNMEYHDSVIEEMMEKYHLEPSNYIVDLLYEALISENPKYSQK